MVIPYDRRLQIRPQIDLACSRSEQGEGALQRLPPLQDIIPEAKLNLVIHYLRTGEVREAHELVKNMEPQSPQEYILKVTGRPGNNIRPEHQS